MEIYSYDSYKLLVKDLISEMPKKGHGQWTKISQHLGVHNVILSQVFRGDKHLSLEQAYDLCDYLGFSDLEREFFLMLVQKEKAGNFRLSKHFEEKIREIRERSQDLKKRLKQDKELTDEVRAMFYSNWYYSGVRLASSIAECQSVEALAERLNLPLPKVKKVIEFLEGHGLVLREGAKVQMGPQRIHIGSESPLASRHHLNWRHKAIERMEHFDPRQELYFTGPYALSKELMPVLRGKLIRLVEECTQLVVKSESETLACLNVDFFEL